MNLLERYQTFIKAHNLFTTEHLILAVSGGVDSIVLCDLTKKSGFSFSIAHCNFRLRGEESDRDEQFVRELAAKYEVDIYVKEFDTAGYAKQNKLSIQEAARELRYSWFKELIKDPEGEEENLRQTTSSSALRTQFTLTQEGHSALLLTAHHADDNVETILMNFFKGTGIAGLRGILPLQEKIARPLLFARKEELLAYAKENGLSWVEDSSNESDKYSRNYLRNQVIPLLEKIYPQAIENIIGNADRFRDIEQLYHQSIKVLRKKLVTQVGNEIHIPVLLLKKSEPLNTIVYELIKDYGFLPGQVNDVIHLLDSDAGKYVASPTHRIINHRKWLIIAPSADVAETIVVENEKEKVAGRGFELTMKLESYTSDNHAALNGTTNIALLDADEIRFPLIIRNWKQGDYFYPLGMRKKKKLARFFIDQKLSKTEKENIRVIEMDKKIIWVMNKRIDDRFKVTDKTKRILKIIFEKA